MYRLGQSAVFALALRFSFGPSPTSAQDLPPPAYSLPTIEEEFAPPGGEWPDPYPCFEFACFNGSDLDGDTLAAVGATYPGIYMYVRDRSGTWALQTVLSHPRPSVYDPPREQPPYQPGSYELDYFARSLALSGDELLASGLYVDETTNTLESHVYVFRRRGSRWTHVQTLVNSGSVAALDRGTALLRGADGVRVYERGWDGNYHLQDVLPAPDGGAGSGFGAVVSLDRDRALVGAPLDDGGVGAAYVFERRRFDWQLSQKITPTDVLPNTGFGSALAISRDRIAIGAPAAPGTDPLRPGQVQLYVRRGQRWVPAQLIANPILASDDSDPRSFGNVLDLEGRRLLVSGDSAYPYAQDWWNYLFELQGIRFRPIAALSAGRADLVRLSGDLALVDSKGLRYGSFPQVFELPR